MTSWYCDTCNVSLKASSKYQHKKTKKHLQNIKHPECTICTERLNQPHSCSECNQLWCGDCDHNISKCPFCRANILGRENQALEQEVRNIDWYYQDERPELPVFPVLELDDILPPLVLDDVFSPFSLTSIDDFTPIYEPLPVFPVLELDDGLPSLVLDDVFSPFSLTSIDDLTPIYEPSPQLDIYRPFDYIDSLFV